MMKIDPTMINWASLFLVLVPSGTLMAQTNSNPPDTGASTRLPYGDIIRLREGEVKVSSGTVGRDQALVSIPYAYRRTAILTADVADGGFWGTGNRVFMKAGAKGYWAGSFSSSGYGALLAPRNLWCFFGVDQRDKETQSCFLSDANGKYIMIGGGYLVTSFSIPQTAYGSFDVRFEEKNVEILADARLEYRFREWDEKDVDVHLFVASTFINNNAIDRQADGTALLYTQGGRLRLTQNGTDKRSTTATLEAVPPPAAAAQSVQVETTGTPQNMATVLESLNTLLNSLGGRYSTMYNKTVGLTPDVNFRPVRAGQQIAIESFVPARVGRLEASPLGRANRFGAVGDLVFEVKAIDNRSVMCWRPQLAGGSVVDTTKPFLLSMCLEDQDKDGKYETLWKDVTFETDMHYALTSLGTDTKLEGRHSPVTIAMAESNLMAPQTIRLVYQGVASERRKADGAIEPASVKVDWSPGVVAGSSRSLFSQVIQLDSQVKGQSGANAPFPSMAFSDVTIDGTANVQVLRGFPSTNTDLGAGEISRMGQALIDQIRGVPPAPSSTPPNTPPKP